jgi:hypothetical protein
MIKLLDITVFALLIYLALSYYTVNAHVFDLVNIIALVYVLVRRADINTKTLVTLGIMYKVVDSVVLYKFEGMNPFLFYTALIILNLFFAYLVIHRPVHFSKYGPWKGSKFTITNQDDVILLFLVVQVIWMVLLLIETATRRINEWFYENSRILYDVYPEIQIGFAVISLMVVWFMTIDKATEQSKFRQNAD